MAWWESNLPSMESQSKVLTTGHLTRLRLKLWCQSGMLVVAKRRPWNRSMWSPKSILETENGLKWLDCSIIKFNPNQFQAVAVQVRNHITWTINYVTMANADIKCEDSVEHLKCRYHIVYAKFCWTSYKTYKLKTRVKHCTS